MRASVLLGRALRFVGPATAALLFSACAVDAPDVGSDHAGAPEAADDADRNYSEDGETPEPLAVVGGKVSAQCAWPSTVDVGGCTGTLIHHQVITTAAHCIRGTSARISFTAGRGTAGAFTLTARCKTGATGASGGGTNRDWAYCVIPEDERVKKFPITPPLVGCEAEKYLKPGASAWVVGFGSTGARKTDNGIKREVEVKVNRATNNTLNIGDRAVGACHGDSGGPLYMKLTDGTRDFGWRVVGSTSSAAQGGCDCTCATLYVNIAQHVKAIEDNEKIDVTPCTDATGKWAPSDKCKNFQATPDKGTGTYPMCSVQMTTAPIETCGANPGTSLVQPTPSAPLSL
jgi:hypothetical protein